MSENANTRLDALTGVEGRSALNEWLSEADDRRHAVLMLFDVDHFKRLNDEFGHAVGDTVLHAIGHALRGLVERYTHARVFRFGGDEFVVAMRGYSLDEGVALARSIVGAMSRLPMEGTQSPVTMSVGVTSSDVSSSDQLLTNADHALLQAKQGGRNRIQVFAAAVSKPARQRLVLNPALFSALDKTLRLAFLRATRYDQTADFILARSELPLKCVRLLGNVDLLIFHLGDREVRFLADVQPFLQPDDDEALGALQYFEVSRVHKFHGFSVERSPLLRLPDRRTLSAIIAEAEGRMDDDDSRRSEAWIRAGFALGYDFGGAEGNVEAYIIIDLPERAPSRELFDIVLRENLTPNPHVITIYEGRGINMNAQYAAHTRSSPVDLFDLVEDLHRSCHRLHLGRVQTTVYLAVKTETQRLYRSLLMPILTGSEKNVRDILILPELTRDEQMEFMFAPAEAHSAIVHAVAQIDEAFATSRLPTDLPPAQQQSLRKRMIRSVAIGDPRELQLVYLEIWAMIEPLIRRLAVDAVRGSYSNLAAAVEDKVISVATANKNLERLTLGEARDILRSFRRTGHDAAAKLPSDAALDSLQPLIELRNRLMHGEIATLDPQNIVDALLALPRLLTPTPPTLMVE